MLTVTYADTTRESLLLEREARSTIANSMEIIRKCRTAGLLQ